MELKTNSFKDPKSSVFEDEHGKIFRTLPFEKSIYEQFDFFSRIIDVHPNGLYEIEKVPFILSPQEFSLSTYIDSGLFYLKCLRQALEKGHSFNDASPSNIAYVGKGEFKFFDLGSLTKYDPTLGWEGYRQFIVEWICPIFYIHDKQQFFPTELIYTLNNSEWYYVHKFSLSKRLNPINNLYFSFLHKNKRKSFQSTNGNTKPKITINQVNNVITLLESTLNKYRPKIKNSKWGNYYSKTVLQDGYPEKKKSVITDIIRSISINGEFDKRVYCDWGANTGEYSKLITSNDLEALVISLESDHNAITENWNISYTHSIIPCFASILNPTPSINFDNCNPSLTIRLQNTVCVTLALGLIHHMQHEINLSFSKIIDYFSETSVPNAHLIIEFIDPTDERYRTIENINYPHPKDIASFEVSLKNKYSILKKYSVSATRTLYHAQKL
jgi:hypothetical protein